MPTDNPTITIQKKWIDDALHEEEKSSFGGKTIKTDSNGQAYLIINTTPDDKIAIPCTGARDNITYELDQAKTVTAITRENVETGEPKPIEKIMDYPRSLQIVRLVLGGLAQLGGLAGGLGVTLGIGGAMGGLMDIALMGGGLAIAGIVVVAIAYGLREGITRSVGATRDVTKDYKSATLGFSNQQIEKADRNIENSTNPQMQNSGPQSQNQNRTIQGQVSIKESKSSGPNCGA
jgi:hypothetical protein